MPTPEASHSITLRFGKLRQGKYWTVAHYLFHFLESFFSLLTPTKCALLSQICQGCSVPGVSFEKYAVVVTKANEASQLGEVLWAWITQYGLYLFLVYLDSFLENHMAEIEEFSHAKLTLGKLSKKNSICKYFEYHIQME